MTPTDFFINTVTALTNTMHTATPAKIVSFDHAQNKAIVQPSLNKAYKTGSQPLPLLNDVPIIFPKGIFFPIVAGDNVLLVFCERSIDLWKQVGEQLTPDDPRKFHLSDAVAIPILQPFNADFSENNGIDYSINFNGSKISISQSGDIQIKTAGSVAIGNTIVELLDVVSQILGFIANPIGVNVPAIPFTGALVDAVTAGALQIQIDNIRGTIT